MTTAHRPTFHAAIGGKEQGGGRYIAGVSRTHVHDLPGQMSIKKRAPGQGAAGDVADKAALRAALGPKARRLAVASVFVDVLGAPPKEEWRQDFGTVWQIAKLLRRPKGSYGSILRESFPLGSISLVHKAVRSLLT